MSVQQPTDPELLDALRLALVPGVGPRIQQVLRGRFGTAAGIFAARVEELQQVSGVGPKLARAIVDHRDPAAAQSELQSCRRAGIELVLRESPAYPRLLAEICDPPSVLYCRGSYQELDELAIAIVGSRHCTRYGRQQAEALAAGLARSGMTIISGLARGIDSAAHQGALAAGGRTIAVSATGLAQVYPPQHIELAAEITRNGAILSESRLQQEPVPGLFPQRNRLISGLSVGVIVVEASRRSGALHTARHAMEQGREVFAVPGRIDIPESEGCHNLIRDGVALVRGVDDVLETLGPLLKPVRRSETEEVHSPRELTLNDQERLVLSHVPTDASHIDEVIRSAEIDPSRVLATLTVLEMKHLVRRLPGGFIVRAPS